MNKLFFFDTETTGIPDFKSPSDSPHQPHIVQAAGLLVDASTRRIEAAFDVIVKPDGWAIPADVEAIHGITTEQAHDCGLPERLVVDMLTSYGLTCSTRVAHNQSFDARIVRIGIKRLGFGEELAEQWKGRPTACTAILSRPICALPKSKTPTLQEAHEHFFGERFEGAHGALPDAEACMKVYFAIQDRAGAHGGVA